MKFDYIVCHYSEIGIKGKNRIFFEKKLEENIKKALKRDVPSFYSGTKNISGRILIKLTKNFEQEELVKSLKNVCGIGYFSFAKKIEKDMSNIKKKTLEIIALEKFETFRITTKRGDKNFSLNSMEVNKELGAEIVKKTGKKVDLTKADLECIIEITYQGAFIYFKKIKGIGGLPVGSSGKVISLLSGGIDSPVASYFACKRGAKNVFVHFHTYPYTPKESISKVKKLASLINKFQYDAKIYLVAFGDLQKEIFLKAPDKLRIILYRRFMMRIASTIAEKEKINALITGESLGQVASQTLENIRATEEVTDLPVLRPLIGMDKEEIIIKAKEIGTFETSILPHDDCCSRFMPKFPETRAKLKEVYEVEEKFDIEKMIKDAINKTEILKI